MPLVRLAPVLGLIVQVALLATLGVGVVGWVAGAVYGIGLAAILTRARFAPADWVTLMRAALAGGVTALVAESFFAPISVTVLIAITVVALLLDAVDGQVARRTGTSSEFGARFDMEVDAFLILALSVYVAPILGAWVLMIGAMRYAYIAAGWVLPWLRGRVPPRYWRKVVAAIQGIVLTAAASDVLPRPLVTVAVAGALALLVESFGRDIAWQWIQRPTPLWR